MKPAPSKTRRTKKKEDLEALFREGGKPSGLGWVLTIIDTLCHEYSWPIDVALRCSLARAFALYSAVSARYGNECAGPSYEEQEMIAELEAMAAKGKSKPDGRAPWAR